MLIEEFLKVFFTSLFEKKYDREVTLKNSPLVSVKVDKKIDYKRYLLLVNNKKITCISHKSLDVGYHYWCIISIDSDGIITLSNLLKQPDFFQNNSFFSFEMAFGEIVKNLKAKDTLSYYQNILDKQISPTKEKIKSFLFCAKNSIFSYPLFLYNEPMLLQFKIINQNLIQKRVQYYFAFKNFGSFSGTIDENSDIKLLSKYHNIIDKNRYKEIVFKKEEVVKPLCEISKSILDLKG